MGSRFTVWSIAAAMCLLPGGAALAVEVTLGFEGFPERVTGSPGEVKTIEGFVTLTTTDNESPYGAQGWFFGIVCSGGSIRSFHTEGIHVSTIFDHDGKPGTPLLDPFDLDLKDAGFNDYRFSPDDRSKDLVWADVVNAVVLHQTRRMTLQPEGTQRIAGFTVEAIIPPEDCAPLTISFDVDISYNGQPMENTITIDGESHYPATAVQEILLCPVRFSRGDANSDSRADISDVIVTLYYLFIDGAQPLCGDSADMNDDGKVDITDPIFLMTDLFSPQWTPLLPEPWQCGFDPTPDSLWCDPQPVCP